MEKKELKELKDQELQPVTGGADVISRKDEYESIILSGAMPQGNKIMPYIAASGPDDKQP